MRLPNTLLFLSLLSIISCTTFTVQVNSVCTNYSGSFCTAWTQTGNITEPTAACLPGSSEVLTEQGVKRMREVRIGDRVLAYNAKTGKDEYVPVTDWLHRSPKASPDYLQIRSQTLEVVVSPDHNVADSDQYTFRFGRDMMGSMLFSGNGETEPVLVIKSLQTNTNENRIPPGAYAPLTSLNNFYVRSSESKVLVHCYAQITHPQKYQIPFGTVMKVSRLFVDRPDEEINDEYWHPTAKTMKGMMDMLGGMLW